MEIRKTLGLTITLISLVCLAFAVTDAVFETIGNVGSTATVRTIGINVWWDAGCTNSCSSIDWGKIEPDETLNRTVYVENPGNTPVTVSLTTSNWIPANMTTYSAVGWNREGVVIEERLVLEALLTLTVYQNVTETMIEDFSFTITITGLTS